MKEKKCLVAIEGIDGSGKSVQAVLLQMALERAGHPAVVVKAKRPDQGTAIRNFTEAFAIGTDSVAFMFLYQAMHRQQYESTAAALSRGKIVIADRWDTSFFAYHSITGPLSKRPRRLLEILNRLAFENLQPDVRFYISIPVRTALRRRIARGDRIASLVKETRFYEQVIAEYTKLFAGKSYHRVDGTLPIEEVSRQMLAVTLRQIERG